MNFSITPLHRVFFQAGILLALTGVIPVSHSANVQLDTNSVNVSGSVIGDDLLYSIGGGKAVSMHPAGGMSSIGVGLGWNSNLICGDMSITNRPQPVERGYQWFSDVDGQRHPERDERGGIAPRDDDPACLPGAL
jgi:hypothetical protein